MTSRTALFRVDASIGIGTGHVMRCLTLADAMAARGYQCTFIGRAHPGHLFDLIRQRGHEARVLPPGPPLDEAAPAAATRHSVWLGTDWETDARQVLELAGRTGWLIVDHYSLDARWESNVRPICSRVLVIDDLADRSHEADMLVDQNFGRDARDYAGRVPEQCRVLTGSSYALLRPEFARLRHVSLDRRTSPELKRVLVSLGGIDVANATGRVLNALKDCRAMQGVVVDVVMGRHAPCLQQVRQQAESLPYPTRILVDVSNMGELMVESDLAIGAAGSTSWERCALGLPSVLVVLAENQRLIANALGAAGAAVITGLDELSATLQDFLGQDLKERLDRMSHVARELVDGEGTARVVEELVHG
jgi:UDP-2,4-diacetamido-2,4,6-trideoxy-beta-L-altropyranose hydrolase